MAVILGIESTCDETAASIVDDGRRVRSNVIASQVDLHRIYRGVVPEIASRAHIENILPVIEQSLADAACDFAQIDAIAVAQRPGLIGSLLIGVTAAKTLAWALGMPLIGVDHVQAHLYSVRLEVGGLGLGVRDSCGENQSELLPHFSPHQPRTPNPEPLFPAIGLVCSGGHTALYLVKSWTDILRIGQTIDDAVGEAYDKVGAILNLDYPGGPMIDKLAAEGNPKAIHFPRSKLDAESLDFSFSGLKTSVLYHVRGHKGRERPADAISPAELRDVCASFQQACIDVLLLKVRRAVAQYGAKSILVGGGVSANAGLRKAMQNFELPSYFPALQYCTDNAAMIAGLGDELLRAGQFGDLGMDAVTFSSITPAEVG